MGGPGPVASAPEGGFEEREDVLGRHTGLDVVRRGQDVAAARGQNSDRIPHRLRHLFGVAGAPPPREVLIVVASDSGPVGFVVDAVSGQRQTVIKPLAKVFRNVPGISATTVLGDGQVALILDVAALIEAVAPAGGEGTTAAAGA